MDSDTPKFIWGAKGIALFLNIVDANGEPDVAEVYYRHGRKQLAGVSNVGRTLVGYLPAMVKPFESESA
jgi:hypothetical protein